MTTYYESLSLQGIVKNPYELPSINATTKVNVRSTEFKAQVLDSHNDGDVYVLGYFSPDDLIKDIVISNDAITGGIDYDFGIAEVLNKDLGDIKSANALADAVDMSSARANTSILNIPNIENRVGTRLWELAGFTARPKGLLAIVLTANTAGTATGFVVGEIIHKSNT